MEVGLKNEVIGKLVGGPVLLNIIFKANEIRMDPKDEPCILNIEQVTLIFVRKSQAKYQFLKNCKSQNLAKFLRFGHEFLHEITIFIKFQTLKSNMVC